MVIKKPACCAGCYCYLLFEEDFPELPFEPEDVALPRPLPETFPVVLGQFPPCPWWVDEPLPPLPEFALPIRPPFVRIIEAMIPQLERGHMIIV